MSKKIITVVGATGLQGGGLVRAILNDPNGEFSVRAITRDLNSEQAKTFEKLGAEVVQGDIGDVESLEKAFAGSYGAFLVSFFWHHGDPERDLQEIKNMAIAAKNTNIEHVVYSTLEDTREFYTAEEDNAHLVSGYRAAHLDVKGAGNQFFKDLNVPTTFMLTTFYWDNFLNPGIRPTRYNDSILLTFPMGEHPLPGIAAEDIGKSAYGIFKEGKDFIGETVGISGEHLTGKQYAEIFSEILNEKITYSPPTLQEYRAYDMPFADDITNSWQFMCDFNKQYTASRNVELSKSINPELQSFRTWLLTNKSSVQIG